MFLDNELAIATTVALDLGPKKPGPGNPIKCIATGVTLNVVVTTGATDTAAGALTTVECGGADLVEFELPSNTLQFVKFAFADGAVNIILPGAQTIT